MCSIVLYIKMYNNYTHLWVEIAHLNYSSTHRQNVFSSVVFHFMKKNIDKQASARVTTWYYVSDINIINYGEKIILNAII